MKKSVSLLSLVLLLILAAAVSIRSLMDDSKTPELETAAAEPAKAQVTAAPAAKPAPEYSKQMEQATDYLDFARSIHEAAKAGDVEAQFHLYRALAYCKTTYGLYFKGPDGWRSLEDAQKNAKQVAGIGAEHLRAIHQRCHRMMQSGAKDLGEAEQWLTLAAQPGNPQAQTIKAVRLFTASRKEPPAQAAESRLAARRLFRAALESRDPLIVRTAGDLLELNQNTENISSFERQAWGLAACYLGLDCQPGSDAVREECVLDEGCQPSESLAEILRRQNGKKFPALEARARQIESRVNAGDWDALGFTAIADAP